MTILKKGDKTKLTVCVMGRHLPLYYVGKGIQNCAVLEYRIPKEWSKRYPTNAFPEEGRFQNNYSKRYMKAVGYKYV